MENTKNNKNIKKSKEYLEKLENLVKNGGVFAPLFAMYYKEELSKNENEDDEVE